MSKLKLLSFVSILLSGAVYAETELKVIEKKSQEEPAVDYSELAISLIDLEGEELLKEDEKITKLREIITRLDSSYSEAKIEELDELKGFYKVINGKSMIYISEDGKYLVPTIARIEGTKFVDLKEDYKIAQYKESLSKLKDNELVTYPASSDKKMSIYVFSDFTCPYCKKLHDNLAEITSDGIEVRYIPYPRNGFNDKPALLGLQKIMCSEDPRTEYDLAFADPRSYVKGLTTQNTSCFNGKSSLHQSLLLGDEMAVYGTPYIFSEDGVFLGTWGGVQKLKSKVDNELLKKEGFSWE